MLQMTRLRKDLGFNRLMGSIVEVLQGVASAEYFHLQKKRKSFDEFEGQLKNVFRIVKLNNFQHSFLGSSASERNIVLITSDAGFLGELNISVVNFALNQYKDGDLFTVVGSQGARYLKEQGREFSYFAGIDDDISYDRVRELRDHIISKFFNKKLGGTIIVYPHFISFALQRTQQLQLLPCRFLFPQDSQTKEEEIKSGFWGLSSREVIIEPSIKRVVEYLVKIWIGQLIYIIFWESKLSEWAARVMHLERSSTEIKNQDKKLKLQYFRLLHQISDNSTREIFASRLALESAG